MGWSELGGRDMCLCACFSYHSTYVCYVVLCRCWWYRSRSCHVRPSHKHGITWSHWVQTCGWNWTSGYIHRCCAHHHQGVLSVLYWFDLEIWGTSMHHDIIWIQVCISTLLRQVTYIAVKSSISLNHLSLWYFPPQNLRQLGVVGKFVEFFGPGVAQLSIADRATISNMCPEYGATVGFFAVDEMSLKYLKQTGN